MARIPRQSLLDFGAQLLLRKGVADDTARYLAGTAVATEAMGIHTHGVVLFPYWDKNVGEEIDPTAEPEIVAERAATALINGQSGFGQLAIRLAREIAAEKARACGVAMVAGRNLSWLGALAPHILPLSQAGFLAQVWAQACVLARRPRAAHPAAVAGGLPGAGVGTGVLVQGLRAVGRSRPALLHQPPRPDLPDRRAAHGQ